MEVSLNYCSQNGGNVYRAPYYNGNPNIGPRIIGNLDQYPCRVQGFGVYRKCIGFMSGALGGSWGGCSLGFGLKVLRFRVSTVGVFL